MNKESFTIDYVALTCLAFPFAEKKNMNIYDYFEPLILIGL